MRTSKAAVSVTGQHACAARQHTGLVLGVLSTVKQAVTGGDCPVSCRWWRMQLVHQISTGGPFHSPCLGPTARPLTIWAAAGSPGTSCRSSRHRAVTPQTPGTIRSSSGLQTLLRCYVARVAAEDVCCRIPAVQMTAGPHGTAQAGTTQFCPGRLSSARGDMCSRVRPCTGSPIHSTLGPLLSPVSVCTWTASAS